MTIRCPECGYENRDMYRFCGMCGATLRREPAAAAPERPAPVVESAPAPVEPPVEKVQTTAPAHSVEYLLEDEPPKSHGKLYLTLVLLALAAGLIIWQWQKGQPSSASTQPTPTAPPVVASTTPQPQPAPGTTPAVKDHASAPKTETPPPATTTPSVSPEPPASPSAGSGQEVKPPDTEADTNPTADKNPSADAAPSSDTDQPSATPVAPPVPSPKPKPDPKVVAPTTPALKGDEKLVAEGEKYLYGNGVPENCDLAQKNLKVAAGHSNARALTLMGAMYATGHCVDRDLPTAYRWFAKALHQDPSNARVQQDLEILWKQMTPGERQLATKTGG